MVHGPGHSPFVSVSIVTKFFFEFHVQALLDYYKAVAAQLMDHLNDNDGLLEEFQSAYKSHQSL